MGKVAKVFIDTDVILDFLFDRKPFSDAASEIFSRCESGKINGFVTPVSFCNAYYILRQIASHEKVIGKLSQLLQIIEVVTMNKEVVIQALNSKFKDFEDALQHYSAINFGEINIILTRNVKDYRKSAIAVLTPKSYLEEIS